VVDAVLCAVAMQRALGALNTELPPHRRMAFRMGVNLGDIVVEQGRIYGDDVNLAARLERLANSGGICISGTVYDQIETKLDLGYAYLGERVVKNIVRPVRVYRIRVEPEGAPPERCSRWRQAYTLRQPAGLAAVVALGLLTAAAVLWYVFRPPLFLP
jgi:class 3 adenylate cyclase